MTLKPANPGYRAERLEWEDEVLREIALPGGVLRMTRGVGSGLARRSGDPPGTFWAIGDRGPNFKVRVATERYGVQGLRHREDVEGAKVMPALDHGPALAELRIEGDRVALIRTVPISDPNGRPLSGLPVPADGATEREPSFAPDGAPLGTDPSGIDSEGVAALADGGFWTGDEYGPSLLRLDAGGRVLVRWVPEQSPPHYEGAAYPVAAVLPALAAARRIAAGSKRSRFRPTNASCSSLSRAPSPTLSGASASTLPIV